MNWLNTIGWLIAIAIGYAVYRCARAPKAAPGAPGKTFAKIRGKGKFEAEVVGESHYADAFYELARRHPPSGADSESFGDAILTLEDDNQHDRNAVAVSIEGLKVGYLSRAMALDFRAAIARDGLTQYREFAVAARLYWGGKHQHHSVQLDIPQA